jgi:hypothetical protein
MFKKLPKDSVFLKNAMLSWQFSAVFAGNYPFILQSRYKTKISDEENSISDYLMEISS